MATTTTTTTTTTTLTPMSATTESPTKLTKKNSSGDLKGAGLTMSKLNGCEHTRQILKQARQQVTEKYSQIVEVLRDPYDLRHRTYKNKDGSTGVTIGITYLCLQCPNVSTSLERHRKDHAFAVESSLSFIYCHECRDFVHDATFDAIREGPSRKRRKVSSQSTTSAEEDRRLVNANTSAVPCGVAGLRGFYNMGQTCFMSVVLQALIHNPLIRTWFLTDGHKSSDCERESCVACALDDIFSDFYSQEKREGYGAVQMLKCCWENSPSLAGYSQQDAHEFLSFILNSLHTAFIEKEAADKAAAAAEEEEEDEDEGSPIKKPPPPTTSTSSDDKECECVIHQCFAGLLQSTVTCSACRNTTTALDPFMDLSLDIRSTALSVKKKKLPMTGATTTVKEIAPMDLWECLERFTATEVLGSDSYTCRKCDSAQEARKKLGLKRLPPVVPIHLKRFSHSKGNGQSSKVETRIRFPFTLDLEPYLAAGGGAVDSEDATYELSAVIVHKGKIDNGHYICYCRQGEYDWFRFDDSMVVMVDDKEVLGAEAYMLVYVAKWVPPA